MSESKNTNPKEKITTGLLNRIFGRKKKLSFSEEDTIPLSRKDIIFGEMNKSSNITTKIQPKSHNETKVSLEENPNQLIACCSQSIGKKRSHNEDSMFCLTTTMSTNGETDSFGLYIVADGMGGHQFGEIASEIATRTMAEYIIERIITNLISSDRTLPDEPIQEIMKKGIEKAHESIQEKVLGGGTTLTAVTLFSNQMTIAHIGDSRIYSIDSDNIITPLTRDHSLVKRLEELGQLTSEEAAVDPRRNVLYHALGQEGPLEPEIISSAVPDEGYLVVCSDGLWGVIPEERIVEIIVTNETINHACRDLVDAANEHGGPDNITVILIKLPSKHNEKRY